MKEVKRNQAKFIEPSTEAKCPYCNKFVKSLENHIKSKHLREKLQMV